MQNGPLGDMMIIMQTESFEQIVKNEFGFLESDFGFTLSESKKEGWGYKMIYRNNTTGVKIIHEYRESYIFILLYQLVNGKLIEDPRDIKEDTVLHSYGLDDIVNLRDPSALINPTYDYPDDSKFHDKEKGMSTYVSAFARNLKTYAEDVLSGDFTIFPELDKIVKERAKKLRHSD